MSRKPCMFFAQGKCFKGDKCSYSHVYEVCSYFRRGTCIYGERCRYYHEEKGEDEGGEYEEEGYTEEDFMNMEAYEEGIGMFVNEEEEEEEEDMLNMAEMEKESFLDHIKTYGKDIFISECYGCSECNGFPIKDGYEGRCVCFRGKSVEYLMGIYVV